MTREQILQNCPEGAEDWLVEVLDHIEARVKEARAHLEDITRYDNLHLVESCYDTLDQLANDLY